LPGQLGSAAAFYNSNVGCIGTGNYPGGNPAQIYYTTDGGNTWTRALMPNMNLYGQITDIFYYDRWNAWAIMRESNEHGWSGLYKSIDGGKTWQLWFQAEFPVSVRQTSRAIFFTDRYAGIRRSTDGGQTFPVIAPSSGSLGLDFYDDNNGISSSEGQPRAPTYVTTDGGSTWTTFDLQHEGWTAYADFATKRLFIASERDLIYPSTESEILSTADNGNTYNLLWSGGGDAITGGIGGPRWCKSVIYAQGQDSSSINPRGIKGFLRSLDGGMTWRNVGGPSNLNDKRFAVTGKGAIVYAFDKGGGVWKTTDGGDGTLSASALGNTAFTRLTAKNTLSAKLCDSADYLIKLSYSDCDSIKIVDVAFIDDTIGELFTPKAAHFFGKNDLTFDTLIIRFRPQIIHSNIERVRISIMQGDGSVEDTIVAVPIEGLAAPDLPVIAEAGASKVIDFGTRSVCGDDSVRVMTITNTGCSQITVTSLSTDGTPFFLLSSFQPFTLDPGISREVLVEFRPTINATGAASGKLTLVTTNSNTVVSLTGFAKAGSRGFTLSQPVITSTICDSMEGDITFKNISCTPVRVDSLGIDTPFRIDPITLPANIRSDSSIILHVHFVPHAAGSYSQNITIHSINDNNIADLFDTVLTVAGVASLGLPELVLSDTVMNFGQLNICVYKDLEVTIANTGCDTLKISDVVLQGAPQFTIEQSAKGMFVLRGDSTKVVIRFKPSASTLYNGLLVVKTNLKDSSIVLTGVGSNDPGTLTLTATPIGAILTCRDSGFTLTLSNTTCDTLTFDSAVFIGVGSADYALHSSAGSILYPGISISVNGTFTPQTGGDRSAIVHFYLHLPDKTTKEITVPMNGAGIQPVVIRLSLPNTNLSETPFKKVTIPVQFLDQSVVDVSQILFSVNLNTNLLDPQGFDMTGSVVSGSVSPLTISNSSIDVAITLTPPQKINPGLLGTFFFLPYVTDTLATSIVLSNFSLAGLGNSKDCLPTSFVVPPETNTTFSLSTACGDSSLSTYMKSGIAGLHIVSIIP